MSVSETFFSLEVVDMERATAFWIAALGASVAFASPRWTSIFIARVRIGLFHQPESVGGRVGLHFVVDDLERVCADVVRAGGSIVGPAMEVAPGVVVADVRDTEGNVFALRRA